MTKAKVYGMFISIFYKVKWGDIRKSKTGRYCHQFRMKARKWRIWAALIVLSPVIFVVYAAIGGFKAIIESFSFKEEEGWSSYEIWSDTEDKPSDLLAYEKF